MRIEYDVPGIREEPFPSFCDDPARHVKDLGDLFVLRAKSCQENDLGLNHCAQLNGGFVFVGSSARGRRALRAQAKQHAQRQLSKTQ